MQSPGYRTRWLDNCDVIAPIDQLDYNGADICNVDIIATFNDVKVGNNGSPIADSKTGSG